MSNEQQEDQTDAVDEALARAQLPIRYRGAVEGEHVEVVAAMDDHGAATLTNVLAEDTGPYGEYTIEGSVRHGATNAQQAIAWARELAGERGLEEVSQ